MAGLVNGGTSMGGSAEVLKRREEITSHIFGLTSRSRGIKYDLSRIAEAVNRAGHPERAYDTFHVAGTNGKGSICAMAESVFRCAGERTGLFTQPHLVDFEERFLVNGRPVLPEAWVQAYIDLEEIIIDLGLTFFEISCLLAFELFRREKVTWAVLETGMGGRLDGTNVVTPRVSVIAGISLEHTDYLGKTLRAIAGEKLGIVKRGVPLVMLEPAEAEVRKLAQETCAQRGAPLTFVSSRSASNVSESGQGSRFEFRGGAYEVPLAGEHQVANAVAALAALQAVGVGERDVLAKGLRETSIPGRFQVVRVRDKTFVFDIAHNPRAAEVTAATLRERFAGKRIGVVTGIMDDKDVGGILAPLNAVAEFFVFTRPGTHRAHPAEKLHTFLPRDARPHVTAHGVADALEHAMASSANVVCVTGSCYTVGEAMQVLDVRPYAGN
jgi:dihydrofolate synthase/folylpolyglutamate synthase